MNCKRSEGLSPGEDCIISRIYCFHWLPLLLIRYSIFNYKKKAAPEGGSLFSNYPLALRVWKRMGCKSKCLKATSQPCHWSSATYPSRPFILLDISFQYQVAWAVAEMMESAMIAQLRVEEKQEQNLKTTQSIFYHCVWLTSTPSYWKPHPFSTYTNSTFLIFMFISQIWATFWALYGWF